MDGSSCQSSLPNTARFVKTSWLVGSALSSICYGILLLLGFLCFTALRRRPHNGNPCVKVGLMVYVLVTITTGTIAEALDIAVTVAGVLDIKCRGPYQQPPNPYIGQADVVFLIINLLTDGLLVWRCYNVARGLEGRIWLLTWILPLMIYIGMIGEFSISTLATGIILTALFSISNRRGGLGDVMLLVQFGISLLLNVMISTSLAAILLHYKRSVSRAFGKANAAPYLDLTTILVESASLVVVVDVFVIVTLTSLVGNIAFQLWVQVQPIASLLIIYRVSRGADYFGRKEEVVESLPFSQKPQLLDVSPGGP
ncbi:hypothetical protein AN958_11199 [Leucoagaricus sp. SymC.cos]|nr:hypothetical protein AN958_11199 [Leucoagaricus sp. SymC.cos]